MKIDTEGTYTLRYTAEDECGNVTTEDRTVVVENITYRTVLYTDGTFIINEKSSDQAANEALHGVATNVYDPLSEAHEYYFISDSSVPWISVRNSITSIEIGSAIQPEHTDNWFKDLKNCRSIDLHNVDWTNIITMVSMFENTYIYDDFTFDCGNGQPTNISKAFRSMCAFADGGVWLQTKTIEIKMDTTKVQQAELLFAGNYGAEIIDISSFSLPSIINSASMFRDCKKIKTIYASSEIDFSTATSSAYMFNNNSNNLVGGAGTVWSSSNPTDKTYAHIDGGTSDPGYFTAKS